MTYRFECRCGKKLEAADEDLGEEIRCPGCGERILLPFKPNGRPGTVGREPLARIVLVLGLLPLIIVIYAAVETAIYGPQSQFPTVFRITGTVLWLGQVVTVVLALTALKRMQRASESGDFLYGEREATIALVLGIAWLAFFVLFLVFYFLRLLLPGM